MSRTHRFSHSTLITTILFLLCVLLSVPIASASGSGVITLSTLGSAYTQDFNTLGNTGTSTDVTFSLDTVTGWYQTEAGGGTGRDNELYASDDGGSGTGDTYSYGVDANTERALGGLQSGSLIPVIGASFTNDTGATITSLDIAYTGEMWRTGNITPTRLDQLDFQLSTNATDLTTGTWTDYDSLDFSSPNNVSVGQKDGNSATNRTAVNFSITGLTIADGATFWIRWNDLNAGGADDGLAVDDFSLTPNTDAPADPVINEFSADTTGSPDVEFVELFADPDTDLSALTVLEIEGDGPPGAGTIDEVIALGTTDANGFLLVNLSDGALENGTISLLLVEGFSGTLGTDLDTNDDGTFDSTPWTQIVDSIAVKDDGASDVAYGGVVLGVSYDGLAFDPGGASRIPDGEDTDTTADWVRNDFDKAGIPPNAGTPVFGEAYNTPGATNQAVPSDAPPSVTSTDPANNATGVAIDSNVIINFSESVTVTDPWFTISCGTSGAHTAGVTGGPTSFTLNPDNDFAQNESCTVTITAANVADQDGTANNMAANYVFSFQTAAPAVVTKIHAIQGTGADVSGGPYTVEAIVVGDYQTQGSGQLRGFFIQEEDTDADANPATSEGIFVFCSSCPTAVAVGDKVQVTGSASEFFNMSQLSATSAGSVSLISSSNLLPTPATIQLPVPGVPSGDLAAATTVINAYFEQFEGMLVTFPDTLSVSEYFELARFGQIILTEGGRPRTFTDANTPTVAGYTNHRIDLASRTIILDDTDNIQNRPVLVNPDTPYYHPVPGLSITNYFRGGDTITNLTGVLHWSFNGFSSVSDPQDAWRIRPVTEQFGYAFTPVNTRPEMPAVEGSLTVASFNVLNYFLTVDTTSSNDSGDCGASGTLDCRGADSAAELERQRTKMLAALAAIDADVFGFMEMENTDGVEPLADIVAGLPGYDYIDTGVIGTDAIRVGIIYKTATVEPVGDYAVISQAEYPGFNTSRNRPALAQTFEEIATGERFTVVVNHLKSKGSDCGTGDDDTTTGQGNCNGTRTDAAEAMAEWLATDPTGSGDPDVLIIGDLNSYAKEDPIVALEDAGYVNLVADFGGPDAYGYVFDGQLGYLDHALANASLYPQVTGVAEWHINADEIPLFDYNDDVWDSGERDEFEEESASLPIYEANEFRTSDHDPVIIGLDLAVPDTTPPDVTINQAAGQVDPTNTSPINFTVVFSEPVIGFETGEVSLSGTAGATTAVVTETGPMDGTTYNVAVSGMTGDGTVIASIEANVADDAADNGNTASTSTDNTVTYDATAPDTTITDFPPDPSNLDDGEFRYESSEGGNQFECSLDGAPFSDCDGGQYSFFDLADGSHTFEVRAIDAAGNVDPTPASYTWLIDTSAPPAVAPVFVSTTAAGTVGPLSYGSEDVLKWDGSAWSIWFNGSAANLTANKATHNLNAISIPDPNDVLLYLSFTQNARLVPGITPKVDGMDIVYWDGFGFSLWFDGQDVGLTNKTAEKVDGLHVLDGSASPIGSGCLAYVLVSTQGPGKVPNFSGGTLNFSGEDVLGFCATALGDTTAGLWHMVLDGSVEGMPKNSTDSISLSDDGTTLYLTTKGTFNVDSATGGHSMVYAFNPSSGQFFGPVFSAPANGLPGKVDGLDYRANVD